MGSPSILDGKPAPKVIDFGIAKATQVPLADRTVWTSAQQFLGTPAYMSPEQAGLGGMDIDTRSDIYALGVLLYELLTGRTPFEKKDLLEAGFDEMRRVIRETEPLRPSARLTQDLVAAPRQSAGDSGAEDGGALPSRRYAQVKDLIPRVRGDLDWIVMKCLEKDRARRYETASGLARDVERHLNNEPVTAAGPGTLYALGKFVRRHRAGLTTAAALVLLLVAGVVVSAWQAVRATRAEQASRTQAAKSRQVAKFLTDMLEGVGPSVALGRNTELLREVLDKTAVRVSQDLANQPEVEAELRNTLGNVYEELGDYAKAESMLRQALALRQAVFGDKHVRVAESLNDLGGVLRRQDKLADAERLFRQSLATRRELLGGAHADVAVSLNNLGVVLFTKGDLAGAKAAHQEALALRQRIFGEDHAEVAVSLHNLGCVLLAEGKNAEAEDVFRRVVGMRRKLLGAVHPLLAESLGNLGTALWYQNKFAAAEQVYRDTLDMQRQLLGPEHPDVATSLHNLACVLKAEKKLAEAEKFAREALELRRSLLGTSHSDYASTLSALAAIYLAQGRFTNAAACQFEAQAIRRTNHTANLH